MKKIKRHLLSIATRLTVFETLYCRKRCNECGNSLLFRPILTGQIFNLPAQWRTITYSSEMRKNLPTILFTTTFTGLHKVGQQLRMQVWWKNYLLFVTYKQKIHTVQTLPKLGLFWRRRIFKRSGSMSILKKICELFLELNKLKVFIILELL